MKNRNDKLPCIDCIWHDQCEDEKPCSFFDDGHNSMIPTDEEIELQIETGRKKFESNYREYISEYSGDLTE